jgi:tetrahydromethanopterin S-methyltransferase subunit C
LLTISCNKHGYFGKQRFYTDVAGLEGIEYANFAPFFSLLLTVIGLIASVVVGAVRTVGNIQRHQR